MVYGWQAIGVQSALAVHLWNNKDISQAILRIPGMVIAAKAALSIYNAVGKYMENSRLYPIIIGFQAKLSYATYINF